jgi:SAM-dependent methyltransferase
MFARQFPDTHIMITDISPVMIAQARQTIKKYGLEDRVDFTLLDVNDSDVLRRLGKFDLIYSVYSMHHWPDLHRGLASLVDGIDSGGNLYLGDLKRVWWLYYLPTNSNDIRQIRAAYRPSEISQVFDRLGMVDYSIKTLFPYFMQSVMIRKSGLCTGGFKDRR